MNSGEIKEVIKERYNKFAERGGVKSYRSPGGVGPGIGCAGQELYSPEEVGKIPGFVFNYSMGCTTPTRLVSIKPGDVVLDIGCGAGLDMLLAVQKVGKRGKVFGVDISPAMIKRAVQAIDEAGIPRYLTGLYVTDMEELPLESELVDVVISNGAINQAVDKYRVYREAYRVMKPRGKMSIADIVTTGDISPEVKARFRANWQGCMGSAVTEDEYLDAVRSGGFKNIEIFSRRMLTTDELAMMLRCPGKEFTPPFNEGDYNHICGKVLSIKFTAQK